MKTFFISDCHFSHNNIIKYEARPFSSMEVMDETMIINWNNKVSNGDRVYIIGDFIFGDEEVALSILNRLNGQKFMIKGNHDSFLKYENVIKKFQWIKDYYKLKLDDKEIILCHYPFEVWDKAHYGSLNIFGHVHSQRSQNHVMRKPRDNQYNAGVDINNFEPVTLEELIANNKIWQEELFSKEV